MEKAYINNLKALWNQFDPLGVYRPGSEWPDDEYEIYILQTLTLLDQGAGFLELFEYIRHIIQDHMEINQDPKDISAFVYAVLECYKQH